MERRAGGLRPARHGRHDDVSHEPPPVAARQHPVLRVRQSRGAGSRRARPPGPSLHAPHVHLPLARVTGGRRPAAGSSRHLLRRRAPGLGLPRGRLSLGVRGRRAHRHGRGGGGRMRSHLLTGKVRHRRATPVVYALEHDVFYTALDLDELDLVVRSLRLFSRNRRNVLQFCDDVHWPQPATDLQTTVRAHLRAEGEDPTDWQITLVTNTRVMGYVFNPASFYLCRDAGGVLRMVVVEVHNTHLERHLYTLRQDPRRAIGSDDRFVSSMDKDFYVSPFIDMEGQ